MFDTHCHLNFEAYDSDRAAVIERATQADVNRIINTLAPYREKIKVVEIVSSGQAALKCLENNPRALDVVVMDYQISGGLFGERLIRQEKYSQAEEVLHQALTTATQMGSKKLMLTSLKLP